MYSTNTDTLRTREGSAKTRYQATSIFLPYLSDLDPNKEYVTSSPLGLQ